MTINTSNVLFLLLAVLSTAFNSQAQNTKTENKEDTIGVRDIYADTWVASDALGRTMPSFEEVGSLKKEQRRVTGIFYITWHTQDKAKMTNLPAFLDDLEKEK